jgi:hypothetical protein
MSVNYNDNRVTATSNNKSIHVKSVKLTFADVVTGGTASVKAVLPAQSTILGFVFWKKTQLSGNGITAATLSIGIPGSATSFVNAADILTPTAGATSWLSSTTTHQNYDPDIRTDISLLFTGTATTGNPTAGEFYVDVYYAE